MYQQKKLLLGEEIKNLKMKRKISILFVILICIISCSFSKKKKAINYVLISKDTIIISENYVKLCYGIETEADTNNFMEHSIQLINTSDYRACLTLFKSRYKKLDTVKWHSGYYGLIIPDPYIDTIPHHYNPNDYLSFRFNNFLGDLVNDEQRIICASAVNSNNPDELIKLQNAEAIYTLYDKLRTPDSVIAKDAINEIKSLLQDQYKGSKRLEYILATAFLVLGEDNEASAIYNRLIAQNYYALLCLKNLIKYLGDRKRIHEQEKYVSIFNKMYPKECLLLERYNQLPLDSVNNICRNCITMGTQRDSIKASIYLANYFFNNKAYKQFDSLTNIYFKEHKYGDSYDELKVYEEKYYSDQKMKELFLLKQFSKMYHYHNSNHLTKAENLSDFKDYVKQLYTKYISIDTSSFDTFFIRNFIPVHLH